MTSVIEKAVMPSQSFVTEAYKSAQDSGGESFKDVLKNALRTIQSGEDVSVKAATGQADAIATLTSIDNADAAVSFIVAFRDRLLQSYKEVASMTM